MEFLCQKPADFHSECITAGVVLAIAVNRGLITRERAKADVGGKKQEVGWIGGGVKTASFLLSFVFCLFLHKTNSD